MTTRRALLAGIAGLALAGGGYSAGAFGEARRQADLRLHGRSTIIQTGAGALEYAIAGDGPPLMMLHGTGGGFDQGLLFAAKLRQRGFHIVAPSPFGYLGSDFPDDASPAHQADILLELLELLDHLGIERLPVIGGSAGAELGIYPTGGYVWLGHDADFADAMAGFIRLPPATGTLRE